MQRWVMAIALFVSAAIVVWAAPVPTPPERRPVLPVSPMSKWDVQLIALQKQALDRAYMDQLHHLFEIWMKDTTGQPARAEIGARKARDAYIAVMQDIEKEEFEVNGRAPP